LRIKKGMTLRRFCEEFSLDPGNISKLERGRLNPTDDEPTLKTYAHFLGLKEKTEDWQTFFDLAAIARNQLPSDLQESDIVERLPVLFRTIRRKKLTDDELDKLIKKIKDS